MGKEYKTRQDIGAQQENTKGLPPHIAPRSFYDIAVFFTHRIIASHRFTSLRITVYARSAAFIVFFTPDN